MATVTLTFTDTDVGNELFSMDYKIAGDQSRDGRYTGAHIIGAFLNVKMQTGSLVLDTDDYIARKKISTHGAGPDDAVTAIMTFTDTNIERGEYKCDVQIVKPIVPPFYTAVLATIECIQELLRLPAFLNDAWAYAEMLASGNPGASVTTERPQTNTAYAA